MKVFTCQRCNFQTAYKCSLITHLKSKTPCPETNSSASREACIAKLNEKALNEKTFECVYCHDKFNDNANRHKHQKICKKKTDSLEEKIKKLEKKLDEVLVRTSNGNNILVNNGNINIQVNGFGSENKSYLSKDFLTKCLRKQNKGMIELIRALHFHPEHHENYNLKVTNKKLPYVEKFVDARWQYCDRAEVIDDLINEGFTILDEHHYDNEEDLKKLMSKRIYDDLDNWLSSIRDKEKDTITPLRRDMYLVILNNSYMVLTKN